MHSHEEIEGMRARVTAILASLPELEVPPPVNGHNKFTVRGRTVGYYLVDHHGDGRLAFACKAAPGLQDALVHADPAQYFVPPYLGASGWVGVILGESTDWDQLESIAREAYRLQAPKRLAALAP
jgi:hypothetical protein